MTLWREAVKAEVRSGDFVTITDVVTNHYKGETSLSTTTRSKLQVGLVLKMFNIQYAHFRLFWKDSIYARSLCFVNLSYVAAFLVKWFTNNLL